MSEEKRGFEEFAENCLYEWLNKIGDEFREGEKYKALAGEMEELEKRLKETLPEDMRPVLRRYTDLTVREVGDAEVFFYKRGWQHAFRAFLMLLALGEWKDIGKCFCEGTE